MVAAGDYVRTPRGFGRTLAIPYGLVGVTTPEPRVMVMLYARPEDAAEEVEPLPGPLVTMPVSQVEALMETSAGKADATIGRARELRALANENQGQRERPGVLAERRDVITLRCITAIALRLSPDANREPLRSV
jgi:hypothetical protein